MRSWFSPMFVFHYLYILSQIRIFFFNPSVDYQIRLAHMRSMHLYLARVTIDKSKNLQTVLIIYLFLCVLFICVYIMYSTLHIKKFQLTWFYFYIPDTLKIILTKQNKLLLQNDIILNKLSAIENRQLVHAVADSAELPETVTEELSKIFVIKTDKDLESFDGRLKKKTYFNYVVSSWNYCEALLFITFYS